MTHKVDQPPTPKPHTHCVHVHMTSCCLHAPEITHNHMRTRFPQTLSRSQKELGEGEVTWAGLKPQANNSKESNLHLCAASCF